jgi:hypothetical protein
MTLLTALARLIEWFHLALLYSVHLEEPPP